MAKSIIGFSFKCSPGFVEVYAKYGDDKESFLYTVLKASQIAEVNAESGESSNFEEMNVFMRNGMQHCFCKGTDICEFYKAWFNALH